jgi:hypothetical protein
MLLPETHSLLQTLATPRPTLTPEDLITITPEEFIQTYKFTKENSSSSPSGRHIGHFKAVLQDTSLVFIHMLMMSLPFCHGFVPNRWTRITDFMLQKEEGNARSHRLHIIALFESDLNQAKQILLGRKLSHHLEDENLLTSMQYGSQPGQQYQSAVLLFSHNIAHLSKHTSTYMENDAIGCYDRIVNNLVLILLHCLGFVISICSCLGALWVNTTHFIKMLYGTSSVTYSNSVSQPLFSPGQGSTTGPTFWPIVFFAIVESLDQYIANTIYQSICQRISVTYTGTAFVDDSSLGILSKYDWNHEFSPAANQSNKITLEKASI